MRITLLTIGSRGDVEPCLSLASALISRGHRPRIAALEGFRGMVEARGFEFLPLAGDAARCIDLLIGRNVGPAAYFRGLEELLDPVAGDFLAGVERACEDTDAIAYSVLGSVAYHAAAARGLPCARMLFTPLDPTGDFPAHTAPYLGRWRAYNRLTYAAGDRLWGRFTRRKLNGWRRELGLDPIGPFEFPYREDPRGKKVPTLCAFSEAVVPKPADWGGHISLTGYWFGEDESGYRPDEGLEAFLEDGPPPVYVGFGSMVGGDFRSLFAEVKAGLERAEVRAIVSSGWGGLSGSDLPPSMHLVGGVPHSWLFKRVAAVAHHGGAGTTAAGIRAGVPTLVVPFGGDQPFWGRRIAELGLGPRPLPVGRLDADSFARSIREAVGAPEYRRNALRLSEAIALERGAEKAAMLLEEAAARG